MATAADKNVERGTMRRDTRPFVVEVRRGLRRPQPAKAYEEPVPPPRSSLDDMLRRAEAALFEAPPSPAQPAPAPESSPPTGRILRNLEEVDPLTALLAESTAPRRRGRKPGSKNKPKPAQEAAAPRGRKAAAGRRAGPEPTDHPTRWGTRGAIHPLPKRELVTPSIPSRRETETGAALRAAHSDVERAPAPSAQVLPDREAARRSRSSILGRYVFGTELKAGERWKRRLRRDR